MRFLLGFISFLGFLALLASGGYYGYGFATGYLQQEVEKAERAIEADLTSTIVGIREVDVTNLYLGKDFQNVAYVVKVDRTLTTEERTFVAKTNNLSEAQEADENFTLDNYNDFSNLLTEDSEAVKSTALTFVIISLSTWIGFWILKKLL